jgi:hypothetical protein
MEKKLAFIVVGMVLGYGFYVAQHKTKHTHASQKESHYEKHVKEHLSVHYALTQQVDAKIGIREYIIDVINNGSSQLHFKPTETMDAGFASKEDAPKIADYLLFLRQNEKNVSYAKDAPLYYSSNCAGCHGEDARGLNGTYPNLLRKEFLGLEE